MAKKLKYTSPVGIAVFPHLTRPDDYKNSLKYKVGVKLSGDDAEKAVAQLKALAKELSPNLKTPKLPFKVDDEGNTILRTSSKYLPSIFDAKNNQVVDSYNPPPQAKLSKLSIGGGSLLRFVAEPYPYDNGLSLQLKSVQIIKLVKFGSGSGFDEADGWEYEEDDESTFDADDENGGEESLDL